MPDFTAVGLWVRTLSERSDDPDASARERLRTCLLEFRGRAKFLAGEIARDLREFTNHDVTHLDALWELADLICGPAYNITPVEAFVLGGAFLIHDLGLGLAAYPGGLLSLKKEPLWLDAVMRELRDRLGRAPTAEELNSPDPGIQETATVETLRSLHASRAEHLALTSWRDGQSSEIYHLIDNPDVRGTYGKLIGRLAHSHWWPVSKLRQEFRETMGAPSFAPNEWTVDPLKVASILRVADISHLDERRAPGFARAVRKPSVPSRHHWTFQEHLQKPHLQGDRLVFTATCPFPLDESEAWWLCFETLQDVDRELQRTDALLADEKRQRFSAKSVAGIEDPKRLIEWIPTDGWFPVDVRVRATKVARLVRTLGGEALYGPDQTVPLRELIQNARDAVHARRLLDKQPDWGRISVSTGLDEEGHWIQVEDNGVGMSEDLLCNDLLDFGNPYWGSARMIRDFPGLLSSGFAAAGTYGIGFFSVFMWGNHVRITTRRFEDARKDTKVLEFRGGPGSRAVLRPAAPPDFLKDGGTRVRVWLHGDPSDRGGVLNSPHSRSAHTLHQTCQRVAPALDVELCVFGSGGSEEKVAGASDWLTIPPQDLLDRVLVFYSDLETAQGKNLVARSSANVRPLKASEGEVIGRACIVPFRMIPGFHSYSEPGAFAGAVAVGGLRSSATFRIVGLLEGKPITAARKDAVPFAHGEELRRWATEQANLAPSLTQDPEDLIEISSIVARCGGDTGDLPIGYFNSKPASRHQIANLGGLPSEILCVADHELFELSKSTTEFTPDLGILSFSLSTYGILEEHSLMWPELNLDDFGFEFGQHTLSRLAIEAVGRAWGLPDGWLTDSYIKALEATYESRRVGTARDIPIFADTYLLVKPSAAPDERES